MKWSKYNNPNRRKYPKRRKSPYSKQYQTERFNELCKLLNGKYDPALIDAYKISINP